MFAFQTPIRDITDCYPSFIISYLQTSVHNSFLKRGGRVGGIMDYSRIIYTLASGGKKCKILVKQKDPLTFNGHYL